MKITIVHTNNKKQLLVSTKTMEKLLQRIAKDDSRLTVTHFREYVTYMESGYEYYKDMPTWMHIYPLLNSPRRKQQPEDEGVQRYPDAEIRKHHGCGRRGGREALGCHAAFYLCCAGRC